MTTSARPMKDRRGRVYTPAVGRRLRPLLWIILGGFALLGANGVYLASLTALTWWQGTTQQTFFYMLDGHPPSRPGVRHPRPVPGLRLRAPGHVVEAAEQGGRAVRARPARLRAGGRHLGAGPGPARRFERFEVRDPTVRAVGYWLHVVTPLLAIGLYVKHRLAGPRSAGNGLQVWGGIVAGFVVLMGLLHAQDPRSFGVRGPKQGKQYFYPVRGGHGQRQVHPGRDADDGRLLPEVPPGRLQGLVPLRAPLQLVQQPGLPVQRARDPRRSRWSATATRRPPAGARAATTRCRSSRASSTTRTSTT